MKRYKLNTLNALKHLAGIPDEVDLISKNAIMPIQDLKIKYLGSKRDVKKKSVP